MTGPIVCVCIGASLFGGGMTTVWGTIPSLKGPVRYTTMGIGGALLVIGIVILVLSDSDRGGTPHPDVKHPVTFTVHDYLTTDAKRRNVRETDTLIIDDLPPITFALSDDVKDVSHEITLSNGGVHHYSLTADREFTSRKSNPKHKHPTSSGDINLGSQKHYAITYDRVNQEIAMKPQD